jgi:creatinine amidohydrolase
MEEALETPVHMIDMTWPEVQKAIDDNKILIFSAGTVEQHGPHLPLGVDTYLPVAIATRVAEKVDAVVAPPTNYGYKSLLRSGGGPHFVGSIGLRGTTFIHLIKDIMEEFIEHGWRRFVVLDWHLENVPFVYEGVDEAIRTCGHADELKVVKIDNPNGLGMQDKPEVMKLLFGDDFPGWAVEHAAIWETSGMMAAFPNLVRKDKIIDGRPPEPFAYDILPAPVDGAPKSGIFWKASLASEEKGNLILDAVTDAIVKVIEKEFCPK